MEGEFPLHSMTLFIEVLQMLELLVGFGKPSGGDREPLLAGTYEQGYYGEVSASEFINGNDLAVQVGLTTGTAFNSDAGWLKFSLDNKTLFVAKRPLRYAIGWDQLNARGVVFGTAQVMINGKLYKVRLLKGRGDGLETVIAGGYDTQPTWGSEWNRLMYHVSGLPFANASNTLASEGITEGNWAQFSEAELLTNFNYGNGSRSWCQESSGPDNRVGRGAGGVSAIVHVAKNSQNLYTGWRPCLELVE